MAGTPSVHNDKGFTYGAQTVYAPSSDWKFIANAIDGPGYDAFSGMPYDRWVGELIANYNGVKNLSLGLDATYGGQDLGGTTTYSINGTTPTTVNSWDIWDIALYAKYALASDWSAALRVENLTDIEADYDTTGGDDTNSIQEGTLTVTHNITPQWSVLAEGRFDTVVEDGVTPTSGTGPYFGGTGVGASNQLTATVASVFAF